MLMAVFMDMRVEKDQAVENQICQEAERDDPAGYRGLPGNAVADRRRRIVPEGKKHRGEAHGIDGYE